MYAAHTSGPTLVGVCGNAVRLCHYSGQLAAIETSCPPGNNKIVDDQDLTFMFLVEIKMTPPPEAEFSNQWLGGHM